MALLEGKNIYKVYGGKKGVSSTNAVNGIDISLDAGGFVGVMGPSGSGKTTLLNLLSGIDKPSSGTITLEQKNLSTMNSEDLALFRRKRMGFVFQEFNLLDSLTIKENIILPMILDKAKPENMEKKAQWALENFGITEIENKYPYTVSGGQQQRTAVARAIINDPAVIFADEPTGNLDTKSSKAVMECFQKMNSEQGATIMMVTHDAFAASFCNRIIFIKDGQIHMELIKKEPRAQFFHRILDSLAVLGGERSEL